DVAREIRARIRLVPPGLLAEIADELLVEGRLRSTRRVLICRPESRGVGRQGLVAEHQSIVRIEAKLELRIRDEDAAVGRVRRGELIGPDRESPGLGQAIRSDEQSGLLARDVLVVPALRLGGGREDRLGEPIRFTQPARQTVPTYLTGRPIVLPARAGQIAA